MLLEGKMKVKRRANAFDLSLREVRDARVRVVDILLYYV